MSRRENWVRLPRERAAAWSKLGLVEQLLATELLRNLDCYEGPVRGDLESHITLAMRGSVRGHDRQRFRRAVATIREAGLLFERDGLIYLLYDEATWREHHHLAPAYVAPSQSPKKVRTSLVTNEAQSRPAKAANDNGRRTRTVREVIAKCDSETQLSIDNHSTRIPRERERLNQSTACSGGEPPAAASPAAVIPLQKAKRKPRAKTPLDRARALALELFNQHYAPRHGGVRSWVGYNLLTPLAGCFMDPEGNFQRERFERTVTAFLDDPRWSAPGERGHGLDVFVWKHSKYARAAAPQIDRSYLEHVL